MPYSPNDNSIIEVQLHMELNGQRLMNVLHYRNELTGGGVIPDGKAFLTDFIAELDDPVTGWTKLLSEWTSEDLLFTSISAQFIFPVRYVYRRMACATANGALVGTALPQNLAASITLQTAISGLHNAGRIQVPGLTIAQVDAGLVNEETRDNMTDLATFLQGPFSIIDEQVQLKLCIMRRSAMALSPFVDDYYAQSEIRTMRRRTVGLGQ